MPPRDLQAILQKLGQTPLKVDSFFLRRTGFIASQTLLKLGEYNLNCVPATIAADEARFLAVLTPSEISLFSRFKEGTHVLILTFDNPDSKDIARFPLRVGLQDIVAVPDRKNVCFLVMKLKTLPGEFLSFLGSYLEALEERFALWESLSAEFEECLPTTVLPAGLGYGAVMAAGDQRTSVSLTRFHTKRIEFRLADGAASLAADLPWQLKLVFHSRPLNLEGRLEGDAFLPEFNPDWLDFVEEARFQRELKAKVKPSAPR